MPQATVHFSFRARLCTVFAVLAMFAGPVQAHQDRLLPVQADGAIPDLRPGGLPYYQNITFFEPGYDPKRKFNSSRNFLFNLNNAKLISVEGSEAAPSDDGGQFGKADLPPDCMLNSDS